jgi:hypothetical protein
MKYIVAFLLLCGTASGQVTSLDIDYYAASQPVAVTFDWSPAAAHHDAVVRVQAGSQGGSGVYIEVDGVHMILTCAHVVGTMDGQGRITGVFKSVKATFRDGTTRTGAPRNDKHGYDIAGIIVEPHPSVPPLKLAVKQPGRPKVEMLGYAGRENKLRHWWGNVARGSSVTDNWYTAGVGSGDSGGPVLNEQCELIGLLAHGDTSTRDDTDGWATYHRAGGPAWTPLRNFAIRLRAFANPSGKNPPLNQRPSYGGDTCPNCPNQGGGGGGLYPPDEYEPQPEAPQPTPADPGCQCPDYSGRLSAIEGDVAGLKLLGGGKGEKGDKGDPGESADTAAIMAAMKVELNTWLEANRESLRGDAGQDSEASPAPVEQRHFIVVGDPSARYWKKLAADVEKTKHNFDAIELVAPPENKNVGTLPALVLYVGSQEAVTYRGTGDVYLQLSRIRRGEFN